MGACSAWGSRVPHFDPASTRSTLFRALLDAADLHGRGAPILEDPERSPLSYGRLILGSLVIGGRLAALTRRGDTVGVLLPNVNAVALVLFGLNAFGRVPALLNFTAGLKNLRSAVATVEIQTVVTSRRFIESGRLDDVIAGLSEPPETGRPVRIVYLEDLRKELTSLDKLRGVMSSWFARWTHARHALSPDEAGVVLFTSGSEGRPKAVVLSNANLLANVRQIEAHIGAPPLVPSQIVLNPLPVFHSYGLTGGLLLGVLVGMRVVLYPSPLHYRQIPKMAKAVGATVLFGTDTFLQGWAKAAEPGDLDSVTLVVAGAERVKEQTREMWRASGAVILEGYGATECSPVIAVNQTFDNRPGTVGRFLPGMEHRLEAVEGLHEGGRLFVRGPNVMAGYVLPDRPGVLVPPAGGWHDTGDIVGVDQDGFVSIQGRARRFAKIGGEMVSLAAIETLAQALWPGATHVAVSLADARKGEQIVLVTDRAEADRAALAAYAKAQGYPELWAPKAVLVTASIPVLGSGKIDFAGAAEMVKSLRPLL
ncbi:AMP-binding protein [Alsobacter sp. KACC 23698]|uniref:AMP-binding protein n=1 Tax=Alsobacter sp. KACC 23698 TaxID=3149229 RepID=A0AAU7JA47_9HYPH